MVRPAGPYNHAIGRSSRPWRSGCHLGGACAGGGAGRRRCLGGGLGCGRWCRRRLAWRPSWGPGLACRRGTCAGGRRGRFGRRGVRLGRRRRRLDGRRSAAAAGALTGGVPQPGRATGARTGPALPGGCCAPSRWPPPARPPPHPMPWVCPAGSATAAARPGWHRPLFIQFCGRLRGRGTLLGDRWQAACDAAMVGRPGTPQRGQGPHQAVAVGLGVVDPLFPPALPCP